SAMSQDNQFQPPGGSASRGPCPALNVLANHGYFPRDGKNLDRETIINGLTTVYNIDLGFAQFLADRALELLGTKNDNGNVVLEDLEKLSTHNVIEHDISLSRLDLSLGDNNNPNAELVEQVSQASKDGFSMTFDDFAQLRRLRYDQCKNNPGLTWNLKQKITAYGESALLLNVFGDGTTTKRSELDTLFKEERLPETFVKPEKPVTFSQVRWTAFKLLFKNRFK
ncbi:Cloroperoxidase, partial [Basidiobolus meristosporus CBS 931.73]